MRRRGNPNLIFFGVIILLLVAAIVFLFTSKTFEREAPNIAISDQIYWNLTSPLPIKITDEGGVKSVKISLVDEKGSVNLLTQKFEAPSEIVDLNLTFPKTGFGAQKDIYNIVIEATDTSKWGFFLGNTQKKEVKITVDNKKPDVNILNHSYAITKGGSATVVFKATDEMLKEVYIETNYGKKFIPSKFVKDGYYASLVAWPAQQGSFSADVVALDAAGNITKSKIRFF